MRYSGIVFVVTCVACSSKDRSAPHAERPVADGTLDASPAPVAPASARVVHCRSSDGKYRVDLSLHGTDPQPRTARVLVDGRDQGAGGQAGVSFGGGFPPPGALTCSKSDDPSNTGCYVANTADYGYIANVHLAKQGKRTVELRQNGIASTHLATLDCDA
jgi:hypothetical protein